MVEYISIAIALLGMVSATISGVVAYGFWSGRWAAGQESATQLLEERMKGMVATTAARTEAKVDSLQQMMAWRAALADKEHATFFARLDKLDEVTGDLQRQIDRRKSGGSGG